MRIGSLFSGIGGLELGLERAGLGHVVWQVEYDEGRRAVLAQHWPDADRTTTDVRRAGRDVLPRVDLLCGGFPCKSVSSAGKREGLANLEKSGLWFEQSRVIQELEPEWVIVENVASGKSRWLCAVRAALQDAGYRTAAVALSAADVGAPHLRRRIFVVGRRLVAHHHHQRREGERSAGLRNGTLGYDADGCSGPMGESNGNGRPNKGVVESKERARSVDRFTNGSSMGHADGSGWSTRHSAGPAQEWIRGSELATRSPLAHGHGLWLERGWGEPGRTDETELDSLVRPLALNAAWVEQLMGFPERWTENIHSGLYNKRNSLPGPPVGTKRNMRGKRHEPSSMCEAAIADLVSRLSEMLSSRNALRS